MLIYKDTKEILGQDAKLIHVSHQFSFTEGPTADHEGNVYFTDQPNDTIWKYDVQGTLSIFLEKTGRSNGLCLDYEGNLLACADEDNQLWSISREKKIKILVSHYRGQRLNGPNDVWAHPQGHIYFTDPHYERSYWKGYKNFVAKQNVYCLSKNTNELVIADDTLEKPNGIVGTADGKYLYVADIQADKTYRYEIGEDGKLKNRALFVNQGSDGMTIDNLGNVYITGKGVTIFNAAGEKLAHIDIPEAWTSNVCFGGKKRNELFITASKSVFTIKTNVAENTQ